MADLSVEESQHFVRLFLTGRANDADAARLRSAVESDDNVALELLSQIQSALDDTAPGGLSPEQSRSVDSRIESLVSPRVRSKGPFDFIKALFRPKVKPASEEVQGPRGRKWKRSEPAEAPAPQPAPEAATPVPTPLPTPVGKGMARRERADAPRAPTPLPAVLPPTTPAPAGNWR